VSDWHNQDRKLPFEEIEAFVEVASAGSFSLAAERLSIAHSSLSRKVARLEDWLGVQLLKRNSKGVERTEIGDSYYRRLRDVLAMMGRAVFSPGVMAGKAVRVSMPHSFANGWLFPLHRKVMDQSGGVRIQFIFDRRLTDFLDGTDIAIRYGSGPWPRTVSVLIEREDIRPIGNIDFLDLLGENAAPDALLQHPLIHIENEAVWRDWFAQFGMTYRLRDIDQVFDNQMMAMGAMRHGIGIGLSGIGARRMMERRRLFSLSAHAMKSETGYHLVRSTWKPLSDATLRFSIALLDVMGVAEGLTGAFIQSEALTPAPK
jgi:LysR family glycine cleavage system transcriptional activator